MTPAVSFSGNAISSMGFAAAPAAENTPAPATQPPPRVHQERVRVSVNTLPEFNSVSVCSHHPAGVGGLTVTPGVNTRIFLSQHRSSGLARGVSNIGRLIFMDAPPPALHPPHLLPHPLFFSHHVNPFHSSLSLFFPLLSLSSPRSDNPSQLQILAAAIGRPHIYKGVNILRVMPLSRCRRRRRVWQLKGV